MVAAGINPTQHTHTHTMKSYSSRKLSNSAVEAKGSKNYGSSSNVSAAAVSVTKFGQATFTSVRRKDYENGNSTFVPLKNAAPIEDSIVPKERVPKVETNVKPKVYKFFKSRSNISSVDASHRSVSSSPKPLMLNSNAKQDGVRQITTTINEKTSFSTYSRANRNDNKNLVSSSVINQAVTLTEKKSYQVQVHSEHSTTINKKQIPPPKSTQFVIHNSVSNVRNATLKPVSVVTKTVTKVVSPATKSGVRVSRRLQGIEPEPVVNSDSNSQSSSREEAFTINNFTDIEHQPSSTTRLTTSIEAVLDDDDKVDFLEKDLEAHGNHQQPNDEVESITELKPASPIQIAATTLIEPICPMSVDIETSEASQKVDTKQNNDVSNSSQAVSIEANLSQESKINIESSSQKVENIVDNVTVKPKKKIFFNRDRKKLTIDTKNFFTSDTKDEFDMAMEASGSQPATNEKKNHPDGEDDDQYIKLKRIKKAHQCHELGETEQFDEDIKYYLSSILSTNPKSMRCLSILGLAQKAMTPEFRMHLRAHDDMPRIIKALMDAPQDSNLALCTAALMFIYNQDRLTMDIDPNALSLMLELLETRSDECNQVEAKHKSKVFSLVEEMKNKGHAKYLKPTEVTAGKLAMETLLGLTSKRAGDWFKAELREMKGIDFIMNTVMRCAENCSEEGHMVKIDRCMHVLENVTFDNIENQLYVTEYREGHFISTCIALLKECKHMIVSSNDSKVFLSAFFSILRVLTNLTSESVDGSKVVGANEGIIELLLESVFELPSFIMTDQRFDLMVIILCLCINLVEFCEPIRQVIFGSNLYMTRLCEFLFKKIDEAVQVEEQTDHLLESHESKQMTEAMQDNLLTQMISKSGTHMEHSLLAACVCLLFGCCVQDSEQNMEILRNTLPNQSFEPLIEMLVKLQDFAHLADIMTQKGKDRVQKVLQIFKSNK